MTSRWRSVLLVGSLAGGLVVPPADASLATFPYYPMGIIEISGVGTSSIKYAFDGFFPDLGTWTCTFPAIMTVECDPPPPPALNDGNSFQNVCMVVTVEATNNGLGTVSGSSRCATGAGSANATSNGPTTTPTQASAVANGTFPWRCSATVSQPTAAPWLVRCTVSH